MLLGCRCCCGYSGCLGRSLLSLFPPVSLLGGPNCRGVFLRARSAAQFPFQACFDSRPGLSDSTRVTQPWSGLVPGLGTIPFIKKSVRLFRQGFKPAQETNYHILVSLTFQLCLIPFSQKKHTFKLFDSPVNRKQKQDSYTTWHYPGTILLQNTDTASQLPNTWMDTLLNIAEFKPTRHWSSSWLSEIRLHSDHENKLSDFSFLKTSSKSWMARWLGKEMQSLSLRAGCRAYKGNSGRQKTNDAEVIKKLKLWHA